MKKDLIGKRVEVFHPAVYHKRGRVLDWSDRWGAYAVEMDGETQYKHDCEGRTEPNRGLWVIEGDMFVIPDVEGNEPAAPNAHYQTNIQPIEFMQANMTPEEFIGFLKGNIIKYTARCGKKDDPNKEVDKIIQYAEWLRDALLGNKIDPRE